MTERFQYSPYGLLLSGDASTTPFLFNGMYGVMTDSNGLYYMRARFYSPEMRRFVNQDVLLGNIFDGQTLNRYAYVTGQPVSYVDPFGLAKLPRPYGGVANTTSIQTFAVGLSYSASIIMDIGGKSCKISTICAVLGPGLYAGTSPGLPLGISMGDIESHLAGISIGLGGDIGFGTSLGFEASCGVDENGITSLGSSKSLAKGGFGYGFWLGITLCNSTIVECY